MSDMAEKESKTNNSKELKRENIKLQKLIEGLEETWGLIVGFLIKGVLKEYGKKAREPLKKAMVDLGRFTGNKYIE
ncbi:MAG: hypothetical protein JSV25_02505, partial [Spirochaetota bacterium]